MKCADVTKVGEVNGWQVISKRLNDAYIFKKTKM